MSDEAIFSRRTARVLTLATVVTFAVTIFFILFGDPSVEITSASADSFSRSALGYRALAELLEHQVPVVVSRKQSELKASPTTPLLLLEPRSDAEALEKLAQMIQFARQRDIPTVVVLPKWRGFRSQSHRGWISSAVLRPEAEPLAVLNSVLTATDGPKADLIRVTEPFSEGGARLLTPQLIRADGLENLVGHQGLALIARLPNSRIYLISDPDLLNTAGLASGDNALVAFELLVGQLTPKAFVIDEVLHGYKRAESIWHALLEFPLICVTLHLATLLLLGLWTTTARFGRPLEPPSRLPPGKLTLVENTARLLALAERDKYAVERYLRLTVRRASRRAALPQATSGQPVEHLAELGRRRGLAEDPRRKNLDELAQDITRLPAADASPRRVLELSRALHQWKKSLERRL